MTTKTKKSKTLSNTAVKQRKTRTMPKGVPFKKNDPETGKKDTRINRMGRPKSFDQLRALGQQLGHELALRGNGEPILSPDGQPMTTTEFIMRQMMNDPKQRLEWLWITYGKPSERHELTGKDGLPLDATKLDEKQFSRAISSLAHAIREIVPGEDREKNSEVDTAEQTPVVGASLTG